jgi:hypothetical protein
VCRWQGETRSSSLLEARHAIYRSRRPTLLFCWSIYIRTVQPFLSSWVKYDYTSCGKSALFMLCTFSSVVFVYCVIVTSHLPLKPLIRVADIPDWNNRKPHHPRSTAFAHKIDSSLQVRKFTTMIKVNSSIISVPCSCSFIAARNSQAVFLWCWISLQTIFCFSRQLMLRSKYG